jgi:signal transduction histidine kinase
MAAAPAATRHTILVVDDEPDVVKSVKDLLRLDYRVLGATSATEGLRILQKEEVHIVMTDQRMPEMTGVEFLSHARGNAPEAIRLLFTGYADIKAVIDAINQGNVYRYISKPWDPDELQSIIREAAQRYELLTERKNLLDRLQEQNAELERANAELKRANDLKYAFIQVASHELRTPLTILIGLTRLASTLPDVKDPLKDWLGRIDSAGKRLQHLVDQLVTILMAGKFDVSAIERRATDLYPLLTQAADDVRPFTQLRGQNLAVDLPTDLGSMDLAADKVRDGVNHLLLNAIKFTPDGGTITLAASRMPNGGAEIRITDTGCGIDNECKPRLFEPFFTGFDVSHHSSGTFEHGRKGLGLGLSVVKAFIEMHGGSIDVKSDEGRGTTFTIKLPPQGQVAPSLVNGSNVDNAAGSAISSPPAPAAATSSART